MTKKGVMQQYIAQFKMLFNRENGRHMDTNDAKEAFEGKLLPAYHYIARSEFTNTCSLLIH